MDISEYIGNLERFEMHAHSEYSNIRLLDSINKPENLILTAAEMGYKGIALTDHEALCGHVKFIQAYKNFKEKGKIPNDFRIALGDEIYLVDNREKGQKYYHFILIAKDKKGYEQLKRISSTAWVNSFWDRGMERVPVLKSEIIDIIGDEKGHLIATTACLGGELATLTKELINAEKKGETSEITPIKQEIFEFIIFCKNLFGEDFYIEVAPSLHKDQIEYNERVKGIAKGMNVRMTFATDAHYLRKNDRYVHESYLNSKDGEREVADFYSYAHLMNNEEAYSYLSGVFTAEEFREMCGNTMRALNSIEDFSLQKNPVIPKENIKSYPKVVDKKLEEYPTLYKLKQSRNIQERYWVNECLIALKEKNLYNKLYLERLEKEADIVEFISNKIGDSLFAYFNTMKYWIDLFWECGSIVGPGRGSATGFLSNYLLGITQLDPIKWRLGEWRFLNKERVELPKHNIGEYKIGERTQRCA